MKPGVIKTCALYNISFINVLFPEPDTPVIQVNLPRGNFTFIFFRLFSHKYS